MSEYKRVAKFLTSGVSAALVEYAVFLLLVGTIAKDQVVVAQTVSFLAGLIVSFSLNRRWVFSPQRKASRTFVEYFALATINLVITNILLLGLHHFLPLAIAKIIIMGCVAFWNYFIFRKVIFR